MSRPPLSIREAQLAAVRQLELEPELRERATLDAALLLRCAMNFTPAQLRAYPERVLNAEEEERFEVALRRRLAHEPVQYITGEQEFYGLLLQVSPSVLIPRPETELLVEAVIAQLRTTATSGTIPIRIADVGTGSGAIAIALAANLLRTEITALDISPAALAVARENAARHNLIGRVRIVDSDLFSALPEDEPPFNAIVSNPPYVAESDRMTLHPEVREYEPASALFAGPAGLDVYRRLIPQAQARLVGGGLLAMEFGFGQQEPLRELLAAWEDVRFLKDLQGIPRTVLARCR